MNIDQIEKLATEFYDNSLGVFRDMKPFQEAISGAMGLSSQALSMLDIYDSGDLYSIVRKINQILSGLWQSSSKPVFTIQLTKEVPQLLQLLELAVSKSKGSERGLLQRSHRLLSAMKL